MNNQRKARLVKKGATAQPTAQPTETTAARVDMRVEVLKKVEKRETVSAEARATWRSLFN